MKFSDDHTTDETCEGVEFVEPDTPELGNLGLGNCDTAEEGEDDDDEGVDVGCNEGRGSERSDGLGEGHGKDLGDEDDEKLVASAGGFGTETRNVVKREEEGDGAEDAIRHFGDDHGESEGECLVGLGHLLTEGDHTGNGVLGFDLSQNEGRQNGDLEDDEDAVLERRARVVKLEVHKALTSYQYI